MLNPKSIKEKIICIYGPTASSKSKLGVTVAQEIGGVIINADSMQVYKEMPILTSQPKDQRKNTVKHNLYGIISPISNFSVGDWLKLAVDQVNNVKKQGLCPILVGGTGLYFSNLIKGIAKIPNITQATKGKIEGLIKGLNSSELHKLLTKYDAELAKKLPPGDKARILRGLEVIVQTSKSILKWQKDNTIFFDRKEFFNIYLRPPKEMVYANINQRFLKMIDEGVENEVRNVLAKYDDQRLPKVIGLSTMKEYILGKKDFDTMVSDVQKLTRNYAKRQYTWFNNQLDHDLVLI